MRRQIFSGLLRSTNSLRGVCGEQVGFRFCSSAVSDIEKEKEEVKRQLAYLTAKYRNRPDFWTEIKHRQMNKDQHQKNKDVYLYFVAGVIGVLGLTYLSVPLYRMYCQATGYGGTVQQGKSVEDKIKKRMENYDEELEREAASREVIVAFSTDTQEGMKWTFKPCQQKIRVIPGQATLAFFNATNYSDKAITGVSTYNIYPNYVGVYFNKIQCFCFEEQRLMPGENIDMPVFFYIDPEFVADQRMKHIDHLTLSYTFFQAEEEEVMGEEDSRSSSPVAQELINKLVQEAQEQDAKSEEMLEKLAMQQIQHSDPHISGTAMVAQQKSV
eukprot:TRINITY_DN4065_c0_g1_i1.p1 TRINITY_DN4065_c0_g1~~TRINITY_DN4065_c0_g1_i1.p1  ORF type:complete len:327 (-),score=56.15 TRINITY_DN4065_c0_g1_i1:233-1213(-)